MFASLDYMHYYWKICHVWQGSFTDKDGNKSIILEAIINQRLWIWHAYFSLPSDNNDLNKIRALSYGICWGGADLNFEINGNVHPCYYLLEDGIYLRWSCFVSTIHERQGKKRLHFSKMQESTHKVVELCFNVL
jgi:hypothetical protein